MSRYFCKLCGAAFTTHKTAKEFCCPEHQGQFKNMRIKQGYRIIEFAIASRLDRSTANIKNANQARRDLYVEIQRICEDERERIAKRAAKIAEIRAGGLQPAPVEPVGASSDEILDMCGACLADTAVLFD